MVWSDWWNFTIGMVSHDRDDFGVYELADDDENTLYIGSGNVRTRLQELLNKKECPLVTRYRIEWVKTEQEAKAIEKHLLEGYKSVRNGKLPLYNEKAIGYEQRMQDLARNDEVQDIMSKSVVTINPEASMAEAARVMGEKHIGSLIVVKYDTPVGMVTERDLLSKIFALGKDLNEVKVEDVMSYPLVTIGPTVKVKEAAQVMIQKKGRLAVFETGKMVGVLTASDLIRSLPALPETEVKVDDFMTTQIVTADEKTHVAKIAKAMGEKGIGSVLITSKGEPFGIFTERDLLTAFLVKEKSLAVEVGKEASMPIITAPVGTSVHKAAVIMAMKHVRRLPIEREGKLVGIITARDLVEAYSK
jgi:CBS domain-containing protein